MILVIGATGTIGSGVVAHLRSRGIACRAVVRNPAKAAAVLGPDVELAVGTFKDLEGLRSAFVDADAVLLVSSNAPRQVEYECNIVDMVASTSRGRVVKISTAGARVGSPATFVDWHGRSEAHLASSGLPATVLRPNFFMSNLLVDASRIAAGQLVAPAGEAPMAMIDPADIAASAAAVLAEEGHDGRTYELTGPEALTYAQVAATLSEVLNRPVEFVDLPEAVVHDEMLASGAPEWLVDGILGQYTEARHGITAGITDTVEVLTGHLPRNFETYVREHAAAFLAATPAVAG